MSEDATSRRQFLTNSSRIAGVSTLAGLTLPHVHAAENNTIQLALVGCGGRGTGAAENALGVKNGPVKIVAMRAYRMGSGGGTAPPKPEGISELMHQIRLFHAFLWASGGVFSDYYIHQIDECCWMKGAWPVEAMAIGGRHYRGNSLDQNFDVYAVQYTYPDGTKLFFDGRNMPGVHKEIASYVHGAKGSAVVSTSAHTPGRTRIYKGQKIPRIEGRQAIPQDESLVWSFPQPEISPYDWEWEDLIAAIRDDKPYNEVKRGAE